MTLGHYPVANTLRRDALMWLCWVGIGVLVGAVLAVAAALQEQSIPDGHAVTAGEFFGALFVPGFVVGLGQWLVLRWRLRVSVDSIFFWLVGSLIGGCAWLSLLDFEDYTYVPSHSFLSGGIYGGGIGAMAGLVQMFALRGRVGRPTLWIVASAVSTGLGWPTGQYVGNAFIGPSYGFCAGYAVVAVLSGLALLCFMHAPGRLARFIGAFEAKEPDLIRQHDYYLAEAAAGARDADD